MITNTDTTQLVHVLIYVTFGIGFIIIILILLMKALYDYVRDLHIQVKAMTPESRALTHAYYTMLYEEHKKNREYDERLDKMFEDEQKHS